MGMEPMAAGPHESFPQPLDTTIGVWRYMNLAKFVWCLQHQSLFFARLDQLGDPYEGYYTRIHSGGEDAFAQNILASLTGKPAPTVEQLKSMYKHMLKLFAVSRTQYFISSWHMNERDSAAMWRLYTSLDESICIKATYANLCDALPLQVRVGVVQYIDYEKELFPILNGLNFVMHKRESYAHEQEVRAVVWAEESDVKSKFIEKHTGLIVPVDLSKMVEAIYVSPSAKPMVRDVVEGLVQTYGLNARVLQSEVNAPPPF
jgi:hypothetical protein